MSENIRVKVAINTDELRAWADRHADAGNHGVAHVLYQAARDAESLTEQALREARADAIAQERAAWVAKVGALADNLAAANDSWLHRDTPAEELRALLSSDAEQVSR